MPEISGQPAGTFCWIDLATTDPEAAKQFYTEVFGWEAKDEPAGEAGVYTMLRKNGKDVGGLYQLRKRMVEMGVPPHWQSYVAVDDADASAAKVTELGGTVLAPPFDVMEYGRMAVVQDSTGAAFALWQAKSRGTMLANEPGAWCWNELYVHDVEAAAKFYSGLFGWAARKSKSPTGEDYTEFVNGTQPAGGMLQIKKEWGEVPPNWSIYLAVADLGATIEKAVGLGAKVEFDPMDIPGIGRFAFIRDPQGAYLALIQMAPGAA